MKKISTVLLTAALGGCLAGDPVYAQTPTPQFGVMTKAEARASFTEAEALYKSNQQDFKVFVDMLALGRLRVMQSIKGSGYEWNREVDDLWVGCMVYQFPQWEALEKIHFQSYVNYDTFYHWIADNEKLASESADTKDLIARLKQVPEWAANCAQMVDQDIVPNGAQQDIHV